MAKTEQKILEVTSIIESIPKTEPIVKSSPSDTAIVSDENIHLDKIYAEASQWVRMANTIVWSAGSILVPSSLIPIGFLASTLKEGKSDFGLVLALAFVSIAIAVIWFRITHVYKDTTEHARDTLIKIEEKWGIGEKTDLAYNFNQLETIKKGNRIINLQKCFIAILVLFWLIVIVVGLTKFDGSLKTPKIEQDNTTNQTKK